jgi:hypothetical protein
MDLDPLELARQLTIMESKLYFQIRPMECLQRAKEQTGEDDHIKTIINTSNRVGDTWKSFLPICSFSLGGVISDCFLGCRFRSQ